MGAALAVGAFGLGALGWTFLEYALHRFDGHGRKGKSLFSREHLQHHAVKDYFTPTSMKVIGTTPVVLVCTAIAVLLFGKLHGLALSAGFVITYVYYEFFHYWLHVSGPHNAYGRWARLHHFAHHYTSAKMNHGVTTPLWDMVFGTYIPSHKLRVPARFAMRWLVDENGKVHAQYAADYEIVGSRIQDHDPDVDLVKTWGVQPTT